VGDLAGNNVPFQCTIFNTSALSDNTPPQLVNYSIYAGQTAVPTNPQFQIQFDEAVSGESFAEVTLLKGTETVPVSITLNDDQKILTLKLSQPLLPNTQYAIHVEGVEDISGNMMAGISERAFTTGAGADLVPTSVVQSSPSDNTFNVSIHSSITISFDEGLSPIALRIGGISLYDLFNSQRVDTAMIVSDDKKTVTLTPVTPLSTHRSYLISTDSLVLTDQYGNLVKYFSARFVTSSAVSLNNSIGDGVSDVAASPQLCFGATGLFSHLNASGGRHISALSTRIISGLGPDNAHGPLFTPPLKLSDIKNSQFDMASVRGLNRRRDTENLQAL
jgi:hypothetical protein